MYLLILHFKLNKIALLVISQVFTVCSNATVLPRINILQLILTKFGTYLVVKRIWNPTDFQGHRVKGYATLCVALVYYMYCNWRSNYQEGMVWILF